MKRRKNKFPLKEILNCCPLWLELAVVIIIIITLVLEVLTYSNYTETKQMTISNYRATTARVLALEADDFDAYLAALETFCLQPYFDSTFSRIIDLSTPVTSEQINYVKKQMSYYYHTRSDIKDYQIYLVNHNITVGKTGNQQHFTESSGGADTFAAAIKQCRLNTKNQYLTTDADGHLCYYHTLISVSDQSVQAIIRLSLGNNGLQKLKATHAASQEDILLINSKNELIYNSSRHTIPFPELTTAIHNHQETLYMSDCSYVMTSTKSNSSALTLVALVPENLINTEIAQMQKHVRLNAFIIWLISLLLIYPFIRLITAPLKRLSQQMQKTGEGDFTTRVSEDGSREINELSHSFNSMVRHIYKLIKKNYIAELNIKDARLAALEAQINPHFLYNTLQAISTEALLNDQMQIHRMITSLASNLRYTIKGSVLVPLRSEMDYVNNYVFLQKMRKEDAFTFQADIDPDTENCLIPKISIQTLIENSLIHGRNQKDTPIHISLTVHKKEDTLVITEEDDGCGISPQQLEDIRQSFTRTETNGQESIGLANLYSRLQILYEKPTDFIIDSEENAYTKITLVLPIAPDHTQDMFRKKE